MDGHEETSFPFGGDGDSSSAVPLDRYGWEAMAPPPSRPAAGDEHGRDWELVAVASASSHDDFSIFPPSRHEGLHLHPVPDSNRTLSLPSSERRGADPELRETHSSTPNIGYEIEERVSGKWRKISDSARRTMELGIELVRYKLCRFSVYPAGVAVWPFATVVGIVGFLIYSRRRQKREKERLLSLIREKDQKINQLLHQVMLLNEILAARHQIHVFRRF